MVRKGEIPFLNSIEGIRLVVAKLPPHIRESWNKKVLKLMEKDVMVTFNHVVEFLQLQVKLVMNPYFSHSVLSEYKAYFKKPVPCERSSHPPVCRYCKNGHFLNDCICFQNLPADQREAFLKTNRLCFSCLQPTSYWHYSKICKNKLTCRICQQDHPTSVCRQNNMKTSFGGGV